MTAGKYAQICGLSRGAEEARVFWIRFALEQAYQGANNMVGKPFSPEVLLLVAAVSVMCAALNGLI